MAQSGFSAASSGSRRGRAWTVASVVATAIIALLPIAAALSAGEEAPRAPQVPAGWQVHRAHGVELAVPADWPLNDLGCGNPDRPQPSLLTGIGNALPAMVGCDGFGPQPPGIEFVQVNDVIVLTGLGRGFDLAAVVTLPEGAGSLDPDQVATAVDTGGVVIGDVGIHVHLEDAAIAELVIASIRQT